MERFSEHSILILTRRCKLIGGLKLLRGCFYTQLAFVSRRSKKLSVSFACSVVTVPMEKFGSTVSGTVCCYDIQLLFIDVIRIHRVWAFEAALL
jgi:hypothetical protein